MMNYPPFLAIFFHPQFGPSYNTMHTTEEFLAIAAHKNSAWAKLIRVDTGEIILEQSNPSAPPAPIPSRSPE